MHCHYSTNHISRHKATRAIAEPLFDDIPLELTICHVAHWEPSALVVGLGCHAQRQHIAQHSESEKKNTSST